MKSFTYNVLFTDYYPIFVSFSTDTHRIKKKLESSVLDDSTLKKLSYQANESTLQIIQDSQDIFDTFINELKLLI